MAEDVRFEATVHPGDKQPALEDVADLDLDRVPDPKGGVRVLIGIEDAARLVERGYEVRLLRALPRRPLDRSLVLDERSARAYLEERTKGITREGD